MKKIRHNLLFLILSTFLVSCGFKIVNQSELINFKINEIVSSGESSINFKLKSKISYTLKNLDDFSVKNINLDLNTQKIKNIKEKNIKNQITKYNLSIIVKIELTELKTNKKISFLVNRTGDYDVANQHSETLNNEKKLIEILTDNLSDDILDELIKRTNDL
tara:strand:- start:388 stop:873 length:486 start_codon:yes stop_codon:yes gene_type:complete